MIVIKPLTTLNREDLYRLSSGYTADARYDVRRRESGETFALELQLEPLPQPYHKLWDRPDEELLVTYHQAAASGFSFDAYDEQLADQPCVGIALAEPQQWNKSLWVWELHVAESHRRRGIGRQLVESLAGKARSAGFRVIVCETQNTNVPAIHFYRQVGFGIEGVDISYYTNEDYPDGEIAIFMKKRLG